LELLSNGDDDDNDEEEAATAAMATTGTPDDADDMPPNTMASPPLSSTPTAATHQPNNNAPTTTTTTPRSVTPPVVKLQRHLNYLALLREHENQQAPHHFTFVAETLLPTVRGRFRVRAYRCEETGAEPLAMIVGDIEGRDGVLCRVHDQCQTSEVFGSLRCDCKEQLDHALERIQKEEGMVIYLPQEGRGIGLANKVAAYAAQEMGLDTVDANRSLGLPDDARRYDAVRDIMADLEVSSLRLMTNNPRKVEELAKLSVKVKERVPIVVKPNSEFAALYVKSKVERMAHMI
jgi:GTP cyclohydrolase II